MVARRREVRSCLTVRYPHNLRGGVGVVEGALGGELAGVLVQGNHLHLVVVFLHEGTQGKTEPARWWMVDKPWQEKRLGGGKTR